MISTAANLNTPSEINGHPWSKTVTINVVSATDSRLRTTCETNRIAHVAASGYLCVQALAADYMKMLQCCPMEMHQLVKDVIAWHPPGLPHPRGDDEWHAFVDQIPNEAIRSKLHMSIVEHQNMFVRYTHTVKSVMTQTNPTPDDAQRYVHVLGELLSAWRTNPLCNIKHVLEHHPPATPGLFGNRCDRYAVVVSHQQVYIGHVYIQPRVPCSMVLDMSEIQLSVCNLIGRYVRDTPLVLVTGVVLWAIQRQYKYLCVRSPTDRMAVILHGLGFVDSAGDYRLSVEDFGSPSPRIS